MSDGMELISAELVGRYGVLPLLPFDEILINKLSGKRLFCIRVSDGSSNPENYKIEVKKPRQSCKHCYGLGYENIFFSNEERFQGHPLLNMCRCLKKDPEAQAVYDAAHKEIVKEEAVMPCEVCQQKECICNVLKAQAAPPKLKASENFREVVPSGEGLAKASINDVIRENTIGEAEDV
jgi:hypothetical protein